MAFDGDGGAGGADAGAAGSAADLFGGAAGGAGGGVGAGAGDAGAGGGAGDGGQGGGDAGGAEPDWYARLSTDADGESASHRDWVKAKGFKDLDSVAKALRHAEKTIHDSGRVKVPGEGATAEELTAWHKAIGVPDDAKGYEFKAPVGEDGKPMQLNQAMLDRLAAAGVKLGAPKGVLEGLAGEIVQQELDEQHAFNAALQADAAKWLKDQGADGEVKVAAIDRAMGALGLSRDEGIGLRNVLGAEKALTLLSRIGANLSEGNLLDGGGRERFAVSGREAQAELTQLRGDKAWVEKAVIPGTPENVRYKRLNDAIGAAADKAAAG